MTKRTTIAMLCLFAASSACSGEQPTTPVRDNPALEAPAFAKAAQSNGKAVTRPMGGRCTTDIHSVVPGPASLVLDMTGSCNLTHLGLTALVIHQECFYAGPLAGTCDNATTLTAANGDKLYGTWHSGVGENTFDGCSAVFEGSGAFTGGTGKFAGATGTSFAKGTATCDPVSGGFYGQYTTDGVITY